MVGKKDYNKAETLAIPEALRIFKEIFNKELPGTRFQKCYWLGEIHGDWNSFFMIFCLQVRTKTDSQM